MFVVMVDAGDGEGRGYVRDFGGRVKDKQQARKFGTEDDAKKVANRLKRVFQTVKVEKT